MGSPPALAGADHEPALVDRPDLDRLNEPAGVDGIRKLGQFVGIEVLARLIRVRNDPVQLDALERWLVRHGAGLLVPPLRGGVQAHRRAHRRGDGLCAALGAWESLTLAAVVLTFPDR